MKRILSAIAIVTFSLSLFAKEPVMDIPKASPVSINGMVSDKVSGEFLTGVKVKLEGSNVTEYTDFDGKFTINNLKPGKYTVLVEYISYDSKKIEKISLDNESGQDLRIRLQPSTISVSNN